MNVVPRHFKRIALEAVGWLLVAAGIVALVLPGPGLLALFAGLALLATQYEWAERRLQPVRAVAIKAAADSVRSWPRISLSAAASCVLIAAGIVWGVHPPVPWWWPVDGRWWLVGGWGTGATLIISGLIALSMLGYSYFNLRERR